MAHRDTKRDASDVAERRQAHQDDGRRNPPPPWRSGMEPTAEQTVAYIVVGFLTTAEGTFTQHFGNMGSPEQAGKYAEKLTKEWQRLPHQPSDISWVYKPARVTLIS